MSSIYGVTSRRVGEYLDALLALGWRLDDGWRDGALGPRPVVRLVGAAMALSRQHAVDGKGRCRYCTRRRGLRRTRTRPCTVYAALSFYLTQPDDLVLAELPAPAQAERTVRLPRIRSGSG